MDISVIIPVTRNESLLKCLDGFNQQQTNYEFEVIAIGAVSENNIIINPKYKLTLIPCSDTHANLRRNIGVRQANANIIGLLDDDCIPEPSWIQQAVKNSTRGIITGYEIPYNKEENFSNLSHKILSSKFGEFTRTHINTKEEKVNWYDIAFCNCIMPKKAWELTNGFSEKIPWDMDDFHFCYRMRNNYLFFNQPDLIVKHDRYPNSFAKLMQYKWKLRKRTGEKIITHSEIYCRVPSVVVAALAPYLLFIILSVCFLLCPEFLLIAVLLYMLPPVIISTNGFHIFRWKEILISILIYSGVHIVTVLAIQAGMLKAFISLFNKRYVNN